ncbi:MAG: leucine-rich repeat protein [Clostridia bacterium]|nr:leucine-rich repeat protein [Clostridia bacterium]
MKKIISIMLTVIMVVSMCGITVFAEDALSPVSNADWTDYSGNVYTWSYSDGVLTIGTKTDGNKATDGTVYGAINTTGSAADTTTGTFISSSADGSSNRPWHDYRNHITKIVLDQAITQIGREMFAGFNALETLTIPKTITSMQWGAFRCCVNLKEVVVEEGITDALNSADRCFDKCSNLESVYLPSTLTLFNGRLVSNTSAVLYYYYGSAKADYVKTRSLTESTNVKKYPYGIINDADGNANSIRWSINEDTNTLVLSDIVTAGTANLPENVYGTGSPIPLDEISQTITINNLVIADGITGISTGAVLSKGLTTVTVAGSVTSIAEYAFNAATIDELIFEEGITDAFNHSNIINRNCKIKNIHLPSTAIDIHSSIYRSLDGVEDKYTGELAINIYVPYGSALTWARSTAQKAKTKNIATITVYSIEIKSIDDDGNVVINNPTRVNTTADVIVAYFKTADDSFDSVVISKDAEFNANADTTTTLDAPAKDGCYRVVYVWDIDNNLVPVCTSYKN